MGSPAAQPDQTSTAVVPKIALKKGSSDRTKQSRESVLPKPKFLAHLESFLEKELRLLGCPSTGPSQLRLQVLGGDTGETLIIRKRTSHIHTNTHTHTYTHCNGLP